MVDDTKESKDTSEAAEQDESSLGLEGQQSMQGLADLRAEQERELREDSEKFRKEHEPWVRARRQKELHAIVNTEPAGENEPQAE
jgi:hypothetical protein